MPKIRESAPLTPGLQKQIIVLIEAGNYIKTACLACGITQATFDWWMKKGQKEKIGMYYDFYTAVQEAEAKAETTLLAKVYNASTSSWAAAMTILERRHPEKYGRRIVDNRLRTDEGDPPVLKITLTTEEKPIAEEENPKEVIDKPKKQRGRPRKQS